MKSYSHLYEIAISEGTRRRAVHKVCLGRKSSRFSKEYMKDEKRATELALQWIEQYKNAEHTPIEIYDGLHHKQRTIIVPTFEELTVQHCCVIACMPMFMKGMYKHSYASIPGRGTHLAKKYIEKWIRKDPRNCKYVLKMDIHHFFDSIPHDVIKEMLKKKIRDKRMLDLLYEIIDVTDQGLPLGFYTSQWLSNWYLQGLDHYIKEQLGTAHYVRYMDDMVIFGANKRKLHYTREMIAEYLAKLGLELKDNWQVFRFDHIKDGRHYGRDLDFMGFRFYRNRTTLRRSIMLKATRKARKIYRKEKATIYDIRQMLSYIGWLNDTNTYGMYTRYIKPCVDFRRFKKRISNYDTRRNRDDLQVQRRNTGRKTQGDRRNIKRQSRVC